MKVAYATYIIVVFWLIASPYWKNSHRANSHTSHDWHPECYLTNINKTKEKIRLNISLATSPLQAPLAHKWNGDLSRTTKTPKNTQNNYQIFFLCRVAYSRSLDKTFDGVKDMETSQTKKRNSSNE